jgi:hypothetical protein
MDCQTAYLVLFFEGETRAVRRIRVLDEPPRPTMRGESTLLLGSAEGANFFDARFRLLRNFERRLGDENSYPRSLADAEWCGDLNTAERPTHSPRAEPAGPKCGGAQGCAVQ